MSNFAHIFKPGKHDPFRCAYKTTIVDPDTGEEVWVPCTLSKTDWPHVQPAHSDTKWVKEYDPKDKTTVRFG